MLSHMSYLRMTIGRWTLDLQTPEGERIFERITEEGAAVFRAQPGFVRYRLMRADARTTIAVAEWESESLGAAGALRFRQWLRDSGIAEHLTLETFDGEVVARADAAAAN
jgi:hypothetical protein